MGEHEYDILRDMLKIHEGTKLALYQDTNGFYTIGTGRNIQCMGISLDEADLMLSNDIERCFREANALLWFQRLGSPRQIVIIDMLFNLGLPKFLSFERMIQALEQQDYAKVASEMLSSKWANQVGRRALELALIMKTGGFS